MSVAADAARYLGAAPSYVSLAEARRALADALRRIDDDGRDLERPLVEAVLDAAEERLPEELRPRFARDPDEEGAPPPSPATPFPSLDPARLRTLYGSDSAFEEAADDAASPHASPENERRLLRTLAAAGIEVPPEHQRALARLAVRMRCVALIAEHYGMETAPLLEDPHLRMVEADWYAAEMLARTMWAVSFNEETELKERLSAAAGRWPTDEEVGAAAITRLPYRAAALAERRCAAAHGARLRVLAEAQGVALDGRGQPSAATLTRAVAELRRVAEGHPPQPDIDLSPLL